MEDEKNIKATDHIEILVTRTISYGRGATRRHIKQTAQASGDIRHISKFMDETQRSVIEATQTNQT